LLLLAAIATLIWYLYPLLFQVRTHFISVPMHRYGEELPVPAVPYFETDHKQVVKAAREAGIDAKIQSEAAELAPFRDRIKDFRDYAGDVLVLYISTHGVTLYEKSEMVSCILCASSQRGDVDVVPIGEVIDALRECPAKEKILLLDAGHIRTAPLLGMLINDFAKDLEAAVLPKEGVKPDEHLWVLSANGPNQSSHLDPSRGRSVFSVFLERGLQGDADLDSSGLIDLAELTDFVRSAVQDWVFVNYGQSEIQRPQLLWGGSNNRNTTEGARRRMQDIVLARVPPAVAERESSEKAAPAADGQRADPAKAAPATSIHRPTRRDGRSLSGWNGASLAVGQPQAPAPPTAPAAQPADTSSSTPGAVGEPANAPAPAAEPGKSDPDGKPAPDKPADGASPAAKSDPANAEDAKAAPAKEQQQRPASPLELAWARHEQIAALDKPWSVIDFAANSWRYYERSLLDYDFDYRLGLTAGSFNEPSPLDRGLNSDEFGPLVGPDDGSLLKNALKVRNRAIYRAIDLVSWHAQASAYSAVPLKQFEPIDSLLRDLEPLERDLDALSDPSRSTTVAGRADLEARLKSSTDRASEALDRAAEAMQRHVNSLLPDDLDSRWHAKPREIQDLLGTALPDRKSRRELRQVWEQVGKSKAPAVERAKTIERAQKFAKAGSESNSRADLSARLQRAREQARLEFGLLQVMLGQERAEKELPGLADFNDVDTQGKDLKKFGARLKTFYRGLSKSIRDASATIKERELRLLRAYWDISADKDERSILRSVSWQLPVIKQIVLAGPQAPIDLTSESKSADFTLTVRGEGGVQGKMSIQPTCSNSQFTLRQLKDGTPQPGDAMKLSQFDLAADRPTELAYRVSWAEVTLDEPPSTIDFRVQAADQPAVEARFRVELQASPPKAIELVVAPTVAGDVPLGNVDNSDLVRDSSTGSSGTARSRSDLDSGFRRVEVYTFPGHKTAFDFKLRQYLPEARKVKWSLYAIADDDPKLIQDIQTRAPGIGTLKKAKELLNHGSIRKVIGDVPLELKPAARGAPSDSAQTIVWPEPPAPMPPAPPAAAPAPAADSGPKTTPISGGLVLVVQEDFAKDAQEPHPWITYVYVAPYFPEHYVVPTVNSDGKGKVTVRVARGDKAMPLDGKPIEIALEESPSIREQDFSKPTGKLMPGSNETVELEAVATGDGDAEVRLRVDGYPRTCICRIPVDVPSTRTVEQFERELTHLDITSPRPNRAYGKDDLVEVAIEATAPHKAFQPEDVGLDYLEVKLSDSEEVQRFYSDRDRTLELLDPTPGGPIIIETKVGDFTIDLGKHDLNKRAKIVATLRLGSLGGGPETEKSDSVECVFDTRPPEVQARDMSTTEGAKDFLEVEAKDVNPLGEVASGIKEIRFQYRKQRSDKAEPEEPISSPDSQSGKYRVPLKADWQIGSHDMVVWAVDNVKLESEPRSVQITVRQKMDAKPGKSGAKTATISGRVVLSGSPARIRNGQVGYVKGVGPAKSFEVKAPVADDGTFVIKDVPPGDYVLEATGSALGQRRETKAPLSVHMPDPAVDQKNKLIELK